MKVARNLNFGVAAILGQPADRGEDASTPLGLGELEEDTRSSLADTRESCLLVS